MSQPSSNQPAPHQPAPHQPAPHQPAPNQPAPNQQHDTQQHGAQPYGAQPYGAQPYGAQPPPGGRQPDGSRPPDGASRGQRGSRVLGSIVSVVLSLLLTPLGVVVFAYGTDRMRRQTVQNFSDTVDAVGAAATVAGTVVLFVVVLLAGWRPAGPFVAGLLYGAVPATVALVVPLTVLRLLVHLPGPASVSSALQTFEVSGGFALLGVALLGSAVAAAAARRQGRTAGRRDVR